MESPTSLIIQKITDTDGLLSSRCREYSWANLLNFSGIDSDTIHEFSSGKLLRLIYHPLESGSHKEPAIIIRPELTSSLIDLLKGQSKKQAEGWNPQMRPMNELDAKEFTQELFPATNTTPAAYISQSGNKILIHSDILLRSFVMLSRIEECLDLKRDAFERFTAAQSIAQKCKFLDQPIVDQYADLLGQCIKKLTPEIARSKAKGLLNYTCDVDVPHDPIIDSTRELVLRLGADLFKRRQAKEVKRRLDNRRKALRGDFSSDPNNRFDWIMDRCEANDLKATFFFLASDHRGIGHGTYRLSDPSICNLVHHIAQRGHRIGLHGAFGTAHNTKQIELELTNLKATGVAMNRICNRQHYLQWDAQLTPDAQEAAGIEEDWSGSFHDAPGFRFGTAHTFRMWSWSKLTALNLKQTPLIMMESSLLDSRYQALSHFPEAYNFATKLKKRALEYGGNFTALWHNSYLNSEADRSLLNKLLSEPSL